jgi:predicted nucleotide-binding protein (sugar kinase/HSP70/actin superfamily)
VLGDSVINHNLPAILERRGAQVVTADALSPETLEKESLRLPKKVYWELGKDLVSAAMHFADDPAVDGIVNVACFGCGQDSFTTALIEHHVRTRSSKPFLNLALDEHNADCAMATRIDAFLDMLEMRGKTLDRPLAGQEPPGKRSLRAGAPAGAASSSEHGAASAEARVHAGGNASPGGFPGRRVPEMRLAIPHMGYLHLGFERVFRNLGVQVETPPRPNKETLMLGARYAPECACLPFKLNLGNMIQALEKGATDIIIPGGFGPCRFGYYGVIQEQILRELGYRFRMGRTDNPDSLRDMLAMVRRIAGLDSKWDSYKVFLFILYRVALVDRALRLSHRTRPRELEKRATDRALRQSLRIIDETPRFRDLWSARRSVDRLFASVPVDAGKPVVRVGVVGEIFMVLENYANMSVEERLG